MGKDKKIKVVNVKIKTPAKKEEEKNEAGTALVEKEQKLTVGFESNVNKVRNAFLRSLALIYFFAFLSIYLQIPGLYGSNGVTPVKAELQLSSRSAEACFQDKLSLLCFIPGYFGIDSQHGLELIALVGVVLSAIGIMCVHCCVAPVFAVLWVLYFSIYNVGNVFMWFQWDILLLETGVLAVIAAPWFPWSLESKPRDLMSLWMVKWLLFRLMFSSGVVKLSSGCPTWWGLSALNHHFETQCLPTPLAFYVHQLTTWILKLLVVGTYYIEILLPFAFFAPFAVLRMYSFWLQILFQIGIILTGNYNFFNLLTIVLCISLLDEGFFVGKKSKKETGVPSLAVGRIFVRTFCITLVCFSLYYTGKYFNITLDGQTLTSKTSFKNVDFNWFISMAVPYSIALGFLTLVSTITQAIIISLVDVKGAWNKFKSLLSVIFYGIICLALFSLTLVPFSSLHKETNQALPEQIREAYMTTSRYHLTSTYGLFRRMTGTDGGRPEVVFEYANDLQGPWSELQFSYKPGNVSAAPTFVVPHQPRLDWQMWFAALGTYHDTPWLVSLSYRILQGQPAVMSLLDTEKLPSSTPPKYIRATLYRYKYTSLKDKTLDWWSRKKDKEFLPIYSVNHAPLVEFMEKLNYLENDTPPKAKLNESLTKILDIVQDSVQSYRPEYVIWGSVSALLTIIFSSKVF